MMTCEGSAGLFTEMPLTNAKSERWPVSSCHRTAVYCIFSDLLTSELL